MPVQFEDIKIAHDAIKDHVLRTPTVRAARLSTHLGIDLYLKLENLQYTNAFRHGARLKTFDPRCKPTQGRGDRISAGNHAMGVAYHAQRLNIPAVIVMPERTPFNKIAKTEDFGAKVVLVWSNTHSSMEETHRLAEKNGYTFIHPFDDRAVVAGQGTIGIEMLEQRPDLDVIVVPIGGGGLMAGVATAVKHIKPSVEIIGAQVDFYAAVKSRIDGYNHESGSATLAEGIAVREPSAKNVEIIRKFVSRVEAVSDTEIEAAILTFCAMKNWWPEGAAGGGSCGH